MLVLVPEQPINSPEVPLKVLVSNYSLLISFTKHLQTLKFKRSNLVSKSIQRNTWQNVLKLIYMGMGVPARSHQHDTVTSCQAPFESPVADVSRSLVASNKCKLVSLNAEAT